MLAAPCLLCAPRVDTLLEEKLGKRARVAAWVVHAHEAPQLVQRIHRRFLGAHGRLVVLAEAKRHDAVVQKLQQKLVDDRRVVAGVLLQDRGQLFHRQVGTEALGRARVIEQTVYAIQQSLDSLWVFHILPIRQSLESPAHELGEKLRRGLSQFAIVLRLDTAQNGIKQRVSDFDVLLFCRVPMNHLINERRKQLT